LTIDGRNRLRVADITYVAIVEGFAYVAVNPSSDARRERIGRGQDLLEKPAVIPNLVARHGLITAAPMIWRLSRS
jgi:hypothetical protein